MSDISYHILKSGTIIVQYGTETHTIPADDARNAKVLQAIKENRLDDIPSLVDISKAFAKSGLGYEDGLVSVNGELMPHALNERILAHQAEGVPFDRLVKFWDKLKQNPSYNARKMLFDFLQHNGHPLTESGNFIAYRGVSEDFKDRHTGKFDNSPGSVCEMPREQVDDNPNNTCSSGLHVAAYEYAYGFGPKRVIVEVDPKDVVCVPVDYNGTKMRVCKFKVISETDSIKTGVALDTESDTTDEDDDSFLGECANCGYANDPDANYCNEYGEDLSS